MFCPVCGTSVPDNAAFCPSCGSGMQPRAAASDSSRGLASQAGPQQPVGAGWPQQLVASQQTAPQQAYATQQWSQAAQPPRRKLPVGLIAGAAAGLVLVAAAVVALVLLRGRGIPIDEAHFPDQALRAWVEEVADEDGDGRITQVEAHRVVVVECERVADITGLDNFENVEELRLVDSELEEVEISGYESLRVVDLSGSESLETVRLDDLSALDELYLDDTGVLHVYLPKRAEEFSELRYPEKAMVHYPDGTVVEPEVDPYPAYAAKLSEYLEKYGNPQVVTGGSTWSLSGDGVCLAELVDFDGDGLEELYIAYYNPSNESAEYSWTGHDANAYVIEAWSFVDGQVRVAYQGQASSSQQGLAYCRRAIFGSEGEGTDGNTTSWIHNSGYEGENYVSSLWSIENGVSTLEHKWEIVDEYTTDMKYLADGKETSLNESEWLDTFEAEWKSYALMAFAPGEGVDECIELTKETMQKLGISEAEATSPEEAETTLVDPADYTDEIESQAKGPVYSSYFDDFDGDGRKEAFVVTGNSDGIVFLDDCEVWYISSNGTVELVSQGAFEGHMQRVLAGDIVESNGHKFITFFENKADEQIARVYGVKDGAAHEMPFDMEGVCLLTDGDGGLEAFVATENYQYMVYGMELDVESFTFRNTGFKRGPVSAG